MMGRCSLVVGAVLATLSVAPDVRAEAPAPTAPTDPSAKTAETTSQEGGAGTTPDVVTLAIVLSGLDGRHPLLDAAAQERGVAEGDLQSADGAFDLSWRARGTAIPLGGYPSGRLDTVLEAPTPWWGLSMFAGYRWGTDSFAEYDGKLETNEFGEVRAGLALPLWRNGPIDRRRANLARAEIGKSLAELTVAERQIELARLASLRYWEWVGAGRRLAIARSVLAIALERDVQISVRALAGDLPDIERVENTRAILQRRQLVVSAERSLQQAAFELSLYHRAADGTPILLGEEALPKALPEPVPPAPQAPQVGAALAKRPELARLRGARDQAQIERDWADNQRYPAIDLTVLGSQDLGEGDPKRQKFELEASIVLDIPIERNVADGRVKSANAQLARAEAQARFAEEQITTQVKDADGAVRAAFERHQLARTEAAVARNLARAEEEKFELGDSSLLLVNLRDQAALDAEVRDVEALVDYHRARATLDAALAVHADPEKVRIGK